MASKQPSIQIRLVSIEVLGPENEPHQVSWILAITIQLDLIEYQRFLSFKASLAIWTKNGCTRALLIQEWDKPLFPPTTNRLLTATSWFDQGVLGPRSCVIALQT